MCQSQGLIQDSEDTHSQGQGITVCPRCSQLHPSSTMRTPLHNLLYTFQRAASKTFPKCDIVNSHTVCNSLCPPHPFLKRSIRFSRSDHRYNCVGLPYDILPCLHQLIAVKVTIIFCNKLCILTYYIEKNRASSFNSYLFLMRFLMVTHVSSHSTTGLLKKILSIGFKNQLISGKIP